MKGAARAALASLVMYVASEWVSPLVALSQVQHQVQHAGQLLLYAPVAMVATLAQAFAIMMRIGSWCAMGAALALAIWSIGTAMLSEEPRRSPTRRRT